MSKLITRETWAQERLEVEAGMAAGELIVLPTDTVYGIGANPLHPTAVTRLLQTKGRGEEMPPPVLVADAAQALPFVDPAAPQARAALTALAQAFWPGPLTVVVPTAQAWGWNLELTGNTVALRQPDHPFTLEILRDLGPLGVSSANIHAAAPATTLAEAREYFGDRVAYYCEGGASRLGRPSTIVKLTAAAPEILREGAVTIQEINEVL